MQKFIVEADNFYQFFDALTRRKYEIIGPKIDNATVIYDKLNSINDLPIGFKDEQDKGIYRLRKRKDKALFGYVVGPYSWKKYLFPPKTRLFHMERKGADFKIIEDKEEERKLAFIGVRACEIHAIHIQDRVFMEGEFIDPIYKRRRENIFIFAVNCTESANSCFCTSMNTGPKVNDGYDLALTEILKPEHYFVIEVGSKLGYDILNEVEHEEADEKKVRKAENLINKNARNMKRHMNTTNIKELLYNNYESKHWDEVAERCLACANCTMVCPTCFCSTVEDVIDLKGEHAERWRLWDSCFTNEFTYIHGNSIRKSTSTKYRHWITHKLASWFDQFGTSGCVGCGRCITWCPAGIDITEEIRSLRDEDAS
ncbi:MAG: 4Fe-4S ferredoxin [Candidatus Nitrosocaldaceae archaeon]|nr:MAG: 4Fe-4S ferredoxin [Candidatus Nitrosocaldaceae archaeon]GIU72773.1 MAG: 4Fe-4S ferredoxin [Candidatus Nitrosocaldaceae archaeon]GIU72827.1 MAG: 4Fe-4S ferredoxin [Candidatus Nitrosocaldaceae archaeon]